jgi:hypothetical protein
MDDGMLDQRGPRTVPAWMPWALGALAVGALVQVGARLAPDWYSIFGPYLLVDADMVVGTVRAVSPFALAAAVLVGAGRWEAGRRWLNLGALALGVQGLLGLGSDIWWAFWEAGPGEISPGVEALLAARSLAGAIALIASAAFLAAGLWMARQHASLGGLRRGAMAVIGLVGLVALGGGLWVAIAQLGLPGGPFGTQVHVYSGLVAIGFGAITLPAVAAFRAMPRSGWMPELLIAVGATLVAGATAWEWAFPWIVPPQDLSVDVVGWVFTLVSAVVTLGFVAMIAGFGAGALDPGRRRHADAPTG